MIVGGGLAKLQQLSIWGINVRVTFLAALLFMSGAANAATTIDFEEYTGGLFEAENPFISQGYSLAQGPAPASYPDGYPMSIGEPIYGVPSQPEGGNNVLSYCASDFCYTAGDEPPVFTLSQLGGGLFDLYSIDFAANGTYTNLTLQVTGYLAGGGTVNSSITSGLNWATLTFGSEWTGLDKVELLTQVGVGTDTAAFDNIGVSAAVPVPAAAWLFGSALAGLGWIKRKQPA